MLLFSTVLSINKSMTKEDFIKLVIEWNQQSIHDTNVIPDIEWHGERNIRFGDEKRWLAIEEYRNKSIIAARYEKCEEDGGIWDTDFVMNFKDRKMSVRLDRSYTPEALMENSGFSTPHFVTQLIERGYLETDRDLRVMRTPHIIDENKLELIADIVKGKKRYRLPIVYVSRTLNNENPVNVNHLASSLKGVAHVLVQESNETNTILREMCDGENEYNGAIGSYYPNQTIGHRKYLYRSPEGEDKILFEKIVRLVINYSNAQLTDTLYTWQGVNNALLRDRLQSQREERLAAEAAQKKAEEETLRILETLDEEERRIRTKALEDAKAEADTLLEGFDDDMQRLQRQVEELTRANEALQYENQGLKAKLDTDGQVPVLYMGDESDLYQGEIKDMVLEVLSDSLSGIHENSRRMDVITDIIETNNYQRLSAKKAEEIKRLMKNYDGMSARLRQELEDFGFEITEDGKHYKLTYCGDARYYTTLGKTPSDGRSGKNSVQQIIRSML